MPLSLNVETRLLFFGTFLGVVFNHANVTQMVAGLPPADVSPPRAFTSMLHL